MTKPFPISPVFSSVRPEDFRVYIPPGIVYKRKPTGFRTYRALWALPPEKKRRPRR
jgi:hypothetical protein